VLNEEGRSSFARVGRIRGKAVSKPNLVDRGCFHGCGKNQRAFGAHVQCRPDRVELLLLESFIPLSRLLWVFAGLRKGTGLAARRAGELALSREHLTGVGPSPRTVQLGKEAFGKREYGRARQYRNHEQR